MKQVLEALSFVLDDRDRTGQRRHLTGSEALKKFLMEDHIFISLPLVRTHTTGMAQRVLK